MDDEWLFDEAELVLAELVLAELVPFDLAELVLAEPVPFDLEAVYPPWVTQWLAALTTCVVPWRVTCLRLSRATRETGDTRDLDEQRG